MERLLSVKVSLCEGEQELLNYKLRLERVVRVTLHHEYLLNIRVCNTIALCHHMSAKVLADC